MAIRYRYIYHNKQMEKRNLFIFIGVVCLLLCACNKDGSGRRLGAKLGSIYGRVTDGTTGEDVSNANVTLFPGSETVLTGYDGKYEFLDVENGDYRIYVSKAEYKDLDDNYPLKIRNGNRVCRDVQIERIPAVLRVTDADGNDIESLDFGSDPSTTVRIFNVFNNGTVSIACNIVQSCVWIRSVSSLPNPIAPGQTVPVSVEIDRSRLIVGENVTNLYIKSGHGNNTLKIKATGQDNKPVVLTLPVTNPDGSQGPFRNTFHGNVTNVGYPPYSKRGFCWSSTNSVPTISDYYVEVPGNGLGLYSYTWWDTPIPTSPITYYVRAWVKYGTNNSIVYGNVQQYTFNDL